MRSSNYILIIIGILFLGLMGAKETETINMYHTEIFIMTSSWFVIFQLEKIHDKLKQS